MKTMNVRLTRKWSDFEAGDVVTVPYPKGQSMIRKRYGDQDRTKAGREAAVDEKSGPPRRRPIAETAIAEPAGETAEITPQIDGGPPHETAESVAEKNSGDKEKGGE